MEEYYLGLDIHKKTISYCIKRQDGKILDRGKIAADRESLKAFAEKAPKPWIGAMEATIFTGWIYDFLGPYAMELKVAHPQMLTAIAASKKKNDQVDAEKIADLLRCNLLPECYMAPEDMRELRKVLRYRNLMVREAVRMQNRMSGLLMESGVPYAKKRLRGKRYFHELLDSIEYVPDSVRDLLGISRAGYEWFERAQKRLVHELRGNPLISGRVERLMTIPGVGELTALTWVLEICDPFRFGTVRQVVSYCGLCSAQKESAGKSFRGPLSKQRNKHLQTMLVEAAKIAPRWNPVLAEVYARESSRGNRNRATLAVARKLAAYMLAVEKRQQAFSAGRSGREAA